MSSEASASNSRGKPYLASVGATRGSRSCSSCEVEAKELAVINAGHDDRSGGHEASGGCHKRSSVRGVLAFSGWFARLLLQRRYGWLLGGG